MSHLTDQRWRTGRAGAEKTTLFSTQRKQKILKHNGHYPISIGGERVHHHTLHHSVVLRPSIKTAWRISKKGNSKIEHKTLFYTFGLHLKVSNDTEISPAQFHKRCPNVSFRPFNHKYGLHQRSCPFKGSTPNRSN